jgi:phospholipase D1/2
LSGVQSYQLFSSPSVLVTATTPEDKIIKNKIGQAIIERIKKAHNKGEKFRIIVVMPLAPAFEGDFASSDAGTVRLVMHFQYASISRGENSIVEKLKAAGIDPDQYIQWFSLRNWDRLKSDALKKSPANTPPPAAAQPATKSEKSLSSPQHYIISKNAPVLNDPICHDYEHHDWENQSIEEGSTIELTKESSNSNDKNRNSGNSFAVRPSVDSLSSPAAAPTDSKQADTTTPDISNVSGSSNVSPEPVDDRLEYVSEQLYIHTKLMIVDDRIVIIGSGETLWSGVVI